MTYLRSLLLALKLLGLVDDSLIVADFLCYHLAQLVQFSLPFFTHLEDKLKLSFGFGDSLFDILHVSLVIELTVLLAVGLVLKVFSLDVKFKEFSKCIPLAIQRQK